MATAKSTRTNSTKTKPSTTSTASKSDTAQVKEGVTKARRGAVSIAVSAAESAVDVPVGAALTFRDRVEDAIEPWTSESRRERELKSLRTQVTREFNRFERRGGQARRKANQRVRSSRNRVEREVKSRRREVSKTVKEARTAVQERVPALS